MQTYSSTQTAQPPRRWWQRIPRRALLGLAVAVLAIGALVWQHYDTAPGQQPAAPAPTTSSAPGPTPPAQGSPDLGDDPDVDQLPPATLTATDPATQDAARTTAQRFATNFATPNGNREDWLARITPDVTLQLARQYRLTDIRNVTQAAVTDVTGPARQAPGSAVFDVGYDDGSRIEIQLEDGTEGWKVIDVEPLATTDGPAPADVPEQLAPAAPPTGEDHP
jgi:hypothetical protein